MPLKKIKAPKTGAKFKIKYTKPKPLINKMNRKGRGSKKVLTRTKTKKKTI